MTARRVKENAMLLACRDAEEGTQAKESGGGGGTLETGKGEETNVPLEFSERNTALKSP